MKYLKIIIPLILFFLILILLFYIPNKYNEKINKDNVRDEINEISLPIIENNKKYIELQTKEWIKKRNSDIGCYGMLEKDKIVMCKWIEYFKIRGPNIHYYDYHDKFSLNKFKIILNKLKGKRLVLKISHLQSNYGIIIIEGNENEAKLNEIYRKCLKLFKSCFVCNHDDNKPPGKKEIEEGKKESYYKLYETVKPGIIIQDFFYSKDNISEKPYELKILLFGDKIIDVSYNKLFLFNDRLELVYKQARKVSKLLGSHLIRVDFFVKYKDNPYIPYINEISLSPNGGINRNLFLNKNLLNKYKEEVSNYKTIKYDFVNNLIKNTPKRNLEIEYYLSDKDCKKEKFNF